MIVAGPEILIELGITAEIVNNVLEIGAHGSRLTVSGRRFQSFTFPDISSFEARLMTRGEGEIIINRSIMVPIRNTYGEAVSVSMTDSRGGHGRVTSPIETNPSTLRSSTTGK
jgi:hypothetical protein